ncbi:MAG: PadR family transcriptional regulator [Candidatus Thorarchaeota archaeon]
MSEQISKFEEKLARKLGEIAILLHLARSSEGSHAYEIRSKASDILFEKRRKGMEFTQNHLDILKELRDFATQYTPNSDNYEMKKNSVKDTLEKCPIFKYNPHFNNLLQRDNPDSFSKDLEYLEQIKEAFESTLDDMKSMSTIWSNISGIYPAIESLEKNELIQHIRDDSEGGRLKKIYQITDDGRKTLARVLISLADLTSFAFHPEDKELLIKKGKAPSILFNPFRDIFRKLAEDIPAEQRKKILHPKEGHPRGPFTRMFMEHGLPIPSFRFLIRHPDLIKDHLNQIESEEERKIAIEFIRTKLKEQKKEIDKIINELD